MIISESNCGISVDQKILQYMVDNNVELLMEVTDKTKADIKVKLLCPYRMDTMCLSSLRVER